MSLLRRRVGRGRPRAFSEPSLLFSEKLNSGFRDAISVHQELVLNDFRRWELLVWRKSAQEIEVFIVLALDELSLFEERTREIAQVRAFSSEIMAGYHTDNPYHNYYHATHVFQVVWMFLIRHGCRDILTKTEQYALLLAALSHDVDHPGVNNQFLRARMDEVAVLYNDRSVLENHHSAVAIRTMMKLGFWSDDEAKFRDFRRLMVRAVLATDMELFRTHHNAMKRRSQMLKDGEELSGQEDRDLLIEVLIHCADISNPVMPNGINRLWASLVIQEFNAQVDLERNEGLPVSTFMDVRTEHARTKSQVGFLTFVVLDQFRALSELVPQSEELVLSGEQNLEDWQADLDILDDYEAAVQRGESITREMVEALPQSFTFRLQQLPFIGMRGPKCFGQIRTQPKSNFVPPSLFSDGPLLDPPWENGRSGGGAIISDTSFSSSRRGETETSAVIVARNG